MNKTLAISILALSLNANLAHANKLAAMAAAELAETIFDKLSDLSEGKCLSVHAIALDRSDISHAVIQNVGNDSVLGLYAIDQSICKKNGAASSSDIKNFAIAIGNEFIAPGLQLINTGTGNVTGVVAVKQ
ncbi:hypothetical protein NBRC116592_34540 [Colwellia sp. KU-HH00111]|uniref:hypothetical protein n=1 Tax=Colwellia sp. KU-HH00111 TaxID=3127652 RepID=UPI0031026660